MSPFRQGKYTPKNPQKYKGNVENIVYRSSWELSFNQFLDNNPNILEWSSEENPIPYFHPIKKRPARYFPDYWVKYRDAKGRLREEIIEVKPSKEAKQAVYLIEHNFEQMPPIRTKNPKTKLYAQLTMLVNAAKWKSAIEHCNKYGIKFRIVTEKGLFK